MIRKTLCLCTIFCAAPLHSAWAGAWTQQQGKGLVIATLAHSVADSGFGDAGQGAPVADFRKTELRAYLEYGVTDWATFVAQPEWRDKKTGSGQGEAVRGLGRIDAGFRLRLWSDDSRVVSVQATGRMPGASDDLAPANGGDTDWEADARVLYGRGFSLFGRHAFTDMQVGYRVRFGAPADELRLDVTAGIDVTPKVLALAQSFNSVSVGSAEAPFLPTREHKVSASLVYRYDDAWSFQIGGLATIAGRNALRERGAILGLWRSF